MFFCFQAAIVAIKIANRERMTDIHIKTDSKYLVKAMTEWLPSWKRQNWSREIQNKDLFQELDRLVTTRKDHVRFVSCLIFLEKTSS